MVKRLSFTTLKRILHILQKLYSSNTQILQFLLRNQNIYNEENVFVNLILRSKRANQTKLLVIIVLLHGGISVLSNVVFFCIYYSFSWYMIRSNGFHFLFPFLHITVCLSVSLSVCIFTQFPVFNCVIYVT